MFTFERGWRPVEAPDGRGRTYRKLLDCQNEEVVERVGPQNHPLLTVAEVRELKIRLNPPKTTTDDVLFLLQQLDEARTEHQVVVARPDLSYAGAPAIDVQAWLAARRAPVCHFIGAPERNSDAYKFGTVFSQV